MNIPDVSRRAFLKRVPGTVIGFYLLSALPAWATSTRRHNRSLVDRSFFAMGSTASIRAFGNDRGLLLQATTKAIEEFQRIENALSIFRESSQTSRVNAEAGRNGVRVGEDLLWIAEWASRVSSLTGGAFDITVGPLMELWGFRSRPLDSPPGEKEILAVLDSVGSDKIVLDVRAKTLGLTHPGSRIDFGGVGVGYAVDRAVRILKDEGVECALVNHSGDASMFGIPDDSEGWELGIPDPASPDTIVKRLVVKQGAIATSGGYRQCVSIGTRRVAHIIDPRSGIPGSCLRSTTVLAAEAVTADALSTSLFCLAEKEASEVLDHFPKTSFIELSREGNETTTREGGNR